MYNGGPAANCNHRALLAEVVVLAGPDRTAAPRDAAAALPLGTAGSAGRVCQGQRPGQPARELPGSCACPTRPRGRPGCHVGSERQGIWLLNAKKARSSGASGLCCLGSAQPLVLRLSLREAAERCGPGLAGGGPSPRVQAASSRLGESTPPPASSRRPVLSCSGRCGAGGQILTALGPRGGGR